MMVVFVREYGPNQIGDRKDVPDEVARKIISMGVALEYKGELKISTPREDKK